MDRDDKALQVLEDPTEKGETGQESDDSSSPKWIGSRMWKRVKSCFIRDKTSPKDDELQGCVQILPRDYNKYSFIAGFRILTDRNIEAWTEVLYRSSFAVMWLWVSIMYFVFIIICCFLIFAIVRIYEQNGKDCLSGFVIGLSGSESFVDNFDVVMSVSWTTFSTVG